MRTRVNLSSLGALVDGNHENPFDLLGPHTVEDSGLKAMAVRAYLPGAKQVWLIDPAHHKSQPMRRIHPAGVYEAIRPLSDDETTPAYAFRVADQRGEVMTMHDPYRFHPLLTDYDVYLLGEGSHWRSYERLGAQLRDVDGVTGVNFAVWAPNASGVSVVGDFNGWDHRRHPMRKLIPSGFWELFIPGVGPGENYKYHIRNGMQVM